MRRFLLTLLLWSLVAPALGAQPHRESPPPPAPARSLELPPLHRAVLPNGLTVWLVERHQVPVVHLELVLAAGSESDPAGSFGLAAMTANLLTEGAGGKSALELADELDYLGATLSSSVGFDSASLSLYVPVARLAPALELMRLVLTRPDFPAAEVERRRTEILTEFLQARDDPDGLMALAFPMALYPKEHRYGTLSMGSETVIAQLTRERLQAFHASAYRPESSVLIVVGDVTPEALLPVLETTFGAWQAGGPPLGSPQFPPVPQVSGRRVLLVDRPGAAQTAIRVARIGVARATADYEALMVMNTLLGGSFTSRLNQNLREKHGYTYGARSRFEMRRQPGPFYAAANVQTDKTGAALSEFFRELDGIGQPIPAAELAKAKNYLAYSDPQRFLTTSSYAGELAEVWTYGLDPESFATTVDRVQAVTADDVSRVARECIVPEDMVIVLVGDRAAILPQLEGLGLGDIETVHP